MTNATNLLARLRAVSCLSANSVGIQIDLETWGKKPGCAIRPATDEEVAAWKLVQERAHD